MGKFFKYLIYTLLTLVLLVIIGIGVLMYTFNPNNLKGPITQQVKAQTGRDLVIDGNITWKFFPWLGLTIQGVNIANNADFGQNTNFIRLKEADIDLKLMPLFSGNIEFGKIKLDGLQLNLVTNAKGENDWDDLVKKSTTATNDTAATPASSNTSSRFKIGTLKISSIEISSAAVTYNNLKTNQKYVLNNFNFSSSNIGLNTAFPVTMNFSFNSTNPNMGGQVNLNTNIDYNTTTQLLTITPFVFNAKLNGANLPKNGLSVNLQTDLKFLNKPNATLTLDNLTGKIANLQFEGKVDGVDVVKNPIFNGTLNIAAFNPKQFLQTLGIQAPNFANQNALTNVSLNSQFILMPAALSITSLQMGLDQSTIKGQVYLAFSNKNQSKINLNIDKLDLSNYLMANTAAPASARSSAVNQASPSQAVAEASGMLPVQQLRELNLTGNLAIGSLNFKKFQMTNVKLNINANNGLIKMNDNQANLYQGQWQSNIALNVQSNNPVWQINEAINNVQVAPLISAFYDSSKYQVTGTGNIKASLTTTGNTPNALTQNLNGTGEFSLNNGVISGIDLGYQMNTALALVDKQAPPSQPANKQTPFGTLTGTVKINNGILSNNDLLLLSPALKVSGKGTANLVSQQVQYQIASTAIQGQVDPRIYNLQEKIGGSIPIRVSGTFASLKVYPDIETILTNMATSYVKQNAGKIKQQVDDQLQKLGGQLQQNLQKGLNNLLQ